MMLMALQILALLAAPLTGASDGLPVELVSKEGTAVHGQLVPAADGRIGLRSDDFVETMEVELERVATLSFAEAKSESEDSKGQVAVRLAQGDLLRGRLLGLVDGTWHFAANGLGTLELPELAIRSIENAGSDALLFQGPNGLAGWSGQLGDDGWQAVPGGLVSRKAGTRIGRELGLDEARRLDMDLAWEGKPRFRIALASRSEKLVVKHVVTVEVWGRSLVAWTDEDKRIEAVELLEPLPDDGSLSLHLRTMEDALVFLGAEGEELGRIARPKRSGGSMVVMNDGEALTIASLLVVDGGAAVQRLDAVDVLGFDAERQVYSTVAGEVAAGLVLGVDFAAAVSNEPLPAGHVSLEYLDGRRVEGQFVRLGEAGIELVPGWQEGPVVASLDGLVRLTAGELKAAGRKRSDKSFVSTANGDLGGELDSIGADGSIVWKPDLAAGAVTLDAKSVGRIMLNRKSTYFASSRKWPHRVLLASGDAFRAKLISIDGKAAVLDAPFGKNVTIASELIRAIEFDRRSMARFEELLEVKSPKPQDFNPWGSAFKPRREVSDGFDYASLERALELPRKYKSRAFPHLVLARTGDFLRTEVVSWSPAGVRYASRAAEPRLIPEARVAAIVWLRSAPTGDETEAVPAALPGQALLVLGGQTKLWMDLTSLEGDQLVGVSPIFGELKIALPELLSIEMDPADLPISTLFDDWMLHPMKEPFPDDADGAEASGLIEVGQAAPISAGMDLDGEPLELKDFRGQVVLLDFWAHW